METPLTLIFWIHIEMQQKKFIQHDPPHPGEILFNLYLKPLNLSVTYAAENLLISRPNFSAIVNGKAGISALMALKLAKALNTTPQYWLNLQSNFDLWKAANGMHGLKKIKVLV